MSLIVKYVFILVFLCTGLHSSTAQKRGFQKGYILEQSGDTIQGFVKDRTPEPLVSLYKKVRFQREGSSRIKKFGPETILGYGYNGNHFVSVPFREETRFFKFRYYSDSSAPLVFLRVVQWSANLIYFEQLFEDDDESYLNTVPFFYKPNSKEYVRVTQGLFGFRKKHLAEYFSECPELIKLVYQNTPEVKSAMDLYESYLGYCAP